MSVEEESQMSLHLAIFPENPRPWRAEIQRRWEKLGPRLAVRDIRFSSSSSCFPLVEAAIHRWHSSRIHDDQHHHHWRRSAPLSLKNFGFLAEPHVNVTSFADKSMTKRARIERKVNAKKIFPVKINLWRTKRSDVPHMRVIVVYCTDYYGTGLLCITEQDTGYQSLRQQLVYTYLHLDSFRSIPFNFASYSEFIIPIRPHSRNNLVTCEYFFRRVIKWALFHVAISESLTARRRAPNRISVI